MPHSSNTVTEKTAQKTVEEIKKEFPQKDRDLIQHAYEVSAKAHETQKRESGEPYIVHPVDAAHTLYEMNMDAQTIAASLLHDVVDDTDVTLKEIEKEFGENVAFLVDGVSKLGKLKYKGAERHAENLRKMLVAMAEDVRVILIKLADRLHNMKTLNYLPQHKQNRIALETLEIYAPTAVRLGVSELGKQLEDLAFPYVYPEAHNYIVKETNYRFKNTDKYLERLRPTLKKALAKEGIRPTKIEMRAKHNYSLWRKLEKYNYNWSQIHDLVAVRIIVDTVEDCYKTMGAIHKLWRPLPGRIKDYIALSKPNGYQSLHTTVFCLDGKRTEFQIRTPEMHENAEYGIAAHWRYKNKPSHSEETLRKTYNWVSQLQEWKKDASPTDEFIENLKVDVFSDRIFVFTPNGDVIDLPQGATPIDFAYSIHSDVGNHCSGATRNGKMIALTSELENGDVVEIATSKNKGPSKTWLNYVKTHAARNHIRRWFRKYETEENKEAGEKMINEELKGIEGKQWNQLPRDTKNYILKSLSINSEKDLFVAVGQGDITVNRITNRLIERQPKNKSAPRSKKSPTKNSPKVIIAGETGLKVRKAKCCNPTNSDTIAAYVTIEQGASVHRIGCPNLYKSSTTDKILPAYWSGEEVKHIKLKINAEERVGMLQDISRCIAQLNINIISMQATPPNKKSPSGDSNIEAEVAVENMYQLKSMIEKIKAVEGVLKVDRVS